MSECTSGELRDLLPELVNGRLDAEMQQEVEAHVASCTECAEELALLRSLRPALVRSPVIDTQGIAAAVRAQTAGGVSRARSREGIATRWRIAIAAAALFAVSALGYVAMHRVPSAESVATAPTSHGGTRDTGSRVAPAAESAHTPNVPAPRAEPLQAPRQQVAVAPPPAATPAPVPTMAASAGVLDNLSDLSDDDVRALTASLDKLSAVPDAEPSSGIDPLGASLDDASAGGR
jgi:anti-sigma factor RsiW